MSKQQRIRPVNHIEQFFSIELKRRGMTRADLARKLWVIEATVYNQLKKDWRKWTLRQITDYCKASGAPLKEAMAAALQDMEEDI